MPMIDWLSLTIDIADYETNCKDLLDKLEKLKVQAGELNSSSSNEKVIFCLGGQFFEVLGNGHKSFAYILHNDSFEIRFMKFRRKQENSYPIFLKVKSECLWRLGPENAFALARGLIERYVGKVTRDKVHRIDLCCHTDEIPPEILTLDHFKGKYKKDDLSRDSGIITGLMFGVRDSGTLYARIYDKNREIIKKSKKFWFYDIWLQHGLIRENVWNVEFELKRDFFKQVQIETCEDFFSRVKDIWDYCSQDWLTLINLNNTRKDRCSVNASWIAIRKAFDGYKSKSYVTRKKVSLAKKEALVPSAIGYFTSYAALSGIKDPYLAFINLLNEGAKLLNGKDTSYKEVINQKRLLKGGIRVDTGSNLRKILE